MVKLEDFKKMVLSLEGEELFRYLRNMEYKDLCEIFSEAADNWFDNLKYVFGESSHEDKKYIHGGWFKSFLEDLEEELNIMIATRGSGDVNLIKKVENAIKEGFDKVFNEIREEWVLPDLPGFMYWEKKVEGDTILFEKKVDISFFKENPEYKYLGEYKKGSIIGTIYVRDDTEYFNVYRNSREKDKVEIINKEKAMELLGVENNIKKGGVSF